MLSVIAGSADVIAVLGLGDLFVAHVTGNLVLLASHVATGTPIRMAEALSVPVFIVAVTVSRLGAARLGTIGRPSLRPLLIAQFVLLTGFLAVAVAAGPHLDPRAGPALAAAMLAVCAMAVQNALVQISLVDAPTTAVMTTNVTRFALDVGALLVGHEASEVDQARHRAARTWPVIVGFVVGATLGALGFAAVGLKALALPTAVAGLALAVAPHSTARSRDVA